MLIVHHGNHSLERDVGEVGCVKNRGTFDRIEPQSQFWFSDVLESHQT